MTRPQLLEEASSEESAAEESSEEEEEEPVEEKKKKKKKAPSVGDYTGDWKTFNPRKIKADKQYYNAG
jgi:hypothetical protein